MNAIEALCDRIATIEDGSIILEATNRTGDDEFEARATEMARAAGYLLEEDEDGDLVAWRFTAEEDAETEEVAR